MTEGPRLNALPFVDGGVCLIFWYTLGVLARWLLYLPTHRPYMGYWLQMNSM